MFISAIITAGGLGQRFGEAKQFKRLCGKPLYEYSLNVFLTSKIVNEVILVVPVDSKERIYNDISNKFGVEIKVVTGGIKREDSVKNGVGASSSQADLIIIHDAARPFLTKKILTEVVYACELSDGAITAIPAVDTIKYSRNNIIEKTIDRNFVWLAQTPQAFNKSKLLYAYKNHNMNVSFITDESSIMENMGYKISIVRGNENNFKITTIDDWKRAEALAR